MKVKKAKILSYTIAILWTAFIILPFLWALRISLVPTYTTYVPLIPRDLSELSLENYRYLLFRTHFPKWLVNSIIVSTVSTVINTLASFLLGYALGRGKLPYSSMIFNLVLIFLMVPYQVTVVSIYIMLSRIRLTNNLLGLILPMSANPFGIFLIRQYVSMIPRDYEEAAIIDGASYPQVLFKVMFPQCLPAIGVLLVTMMIETWNNFILPLVIITRTTMKTVTLGVADLAFEILNTNWGVLMAGSLLATVPTVIIYILFNRYFLSGLTLQGGLK